MSIYAIAQLLMHTIPTTIAGAYKDAPMELSEQPKIQQ